LGPRTGHEDRWGEELKVSKLIVLCMKWDLSWSGAQGGTAQEVRPRQAVSLFPAVQWRKWDKRFLKYVVCTREMQNLGHISSTEISYQMLWQFCEGNETICQRVICTPVYQSTIHRSQKSESS
jgi:hypothetical protein